MKEISDNWLSVKSALEQIVYKHRPKNRPYQVILEQVNDLEAANRVKISYNHFVKSFASICEQIIDFLLYLDEEIRYKQEIGYKQNITLVMVVSEVSRVTIAGVLSLMATYVGDSRLLKELKDVASNYMLLNLIQRFSRKGGEWFDESGELMKKSNNGGELQVLEFYGHEILHELKIKMVHDGYTKGVEKDMVIVINKLEKTISKFSKTIENMISHVQNPKYKYQ